MATFNILEEIENYPNYAHTKMAKIAEVKNNKKTFLGNGNQFNGFGVCNEKNLKKCCDIVEKPKTPEEIPQELEIDVSVLKIEKSVSEEKNKSEGEYFPPCLASNDEYRQDLWKYLTVLEENFPRTKRNYMIKQPELNWHSRAILVDWLASVAAEYKLAEETFHLGVNYLDRVLSTVSVKRKKLQLVGAAAMRLASKMEEYYPMDCDEWSYLTDNTYTKEEVIKMEYMLLNILKFKMNAPTTLEFVQILCTEFSMEEEVIHMAKYIMELMLLEADEYLKYLPSRLAAGAIVIARYSLRKNDVWPDVLKIFTGFSLKELKPILTMQLKTLKNDSTRDLKAIKQKYSEPKYSKVAERDIRLK